MMNICICYLPNTVPYLAARGNFSGNNGEPEASRYTGKINSSSKMWNSIWQITYLYVTCDDELIFECLKMLFHFKIKSLPRYTVERSIMHHSDNCNAVVYASALTLSSNQSARLLSSMT